MEGRMKTGKDIKTGMRVTVEPWQCIGRRPFEGTIICRRGGAIRFKPDELPNHGVGTGIFAVPGWTQSDCETFRVNILDITCVEGKPIEEWATN